jgi:hypothetical protein
MGMLGFDLYRQTLKFVNVDISLRIIFEIMFCIDTLFYCAGGKIEMNEMGRACGAYGGG